MIRILLPFGLVFGFFTYALTAMGTSVNLDDPYTTTYVLASTDTIPDITDRTEDYITQPNTNPFDLNDPSVIKSVG